MNNKTDKLICEGVENYIRSQIPSIAKNLHEAIGKGFLTRAGMLAREKILNFRARRKLNLQADREATTEVVGRLHNALIPHLQASGIDPALYRAVLKHPSVDQLRDMASAGLNITKRQQDLAFQRQQVERTIIDRSQFNPEMARILHSIKKLQSGYEAQERAAVLANDPTKPGTLAYRANQLRDRRLALRNQRIQEIPLEYASYNNPLFPKPLFKTPPGSSVPVPTGSQRNLLVKSTGRPNYAVVLGGSGRGGAKLVDPNLQLRPLGRILSKLETIV